MSDFETFDADLGNNEIPEQDPAADFIQREQDALAKIENPEVGLNDFVAPDFPNDMNSVPNIINTECTEPGTPENEESENDVLECNGTEPGIPENEESENNVLECNSTEPETAENEESESNVLECNSTEPGTAENEESEKNVLECNHMNGPSNNEFPTSAPPSRPANREEPEKIRIWREEQQKMLEIKDSEEEKKKQELRESAQKELDDWYARYKEQIEKSKLNNRNAEKEWVADRDAESPGQEWERIARLCDFNPKSSRSTKDTSRMRSIILQLKQSPVPPRKG